MPGCINHESSPPKIRLIINKHRPIINHIVSISFGLQELGESFESSNKSRVKVGNKLPFLVLSNCKLIFLVVDSFRKHNSPIFDNDVHYDLHSSSADALKFRLVKMTIV